MMSYEDFKDFYFRYGKCINDTQVRKNSLNETQLKSRYKKYQEAEKKREERQARTKEKLKEQKLKIDEKWEALKKELDLSACLLTEQLLYASMTDSIHVLHVNAGNLFNTIDPAHVYGKGAYPHMKYDKENVVPLNRYSHFCLDNARDPITGANISYEQVFKWWEFIVGSDTFKRLEEKSKRRGLT